jgi:hypothetical protein
VGKTKKKITAMIACCTENETSENEKGNREKKGQLVVLAQKSGTERKEEE